MSKLVSRALFALGIVALALPAGVQGQVGLSSGVSRVTLVARAPLQGSLEGRLSQPVIGIPDGSRQGTITLRISANSGYRLMVRGTAATPTDTRVWVRSVSGEFQEIREGSSVVVADDAHPAGGEERQVQYRIEGAADHSAPPPICYELQISPTL